MELPVRWHVHWQSVQRRRRAGRADGTERRTPGPLPAIGEWKGEAFRVGVELWMVGTSGLGGHDALRAIRMREALRPSKRACVRTCVARDGGWGMIEGEKGSTIPLGCVLQAAVCAVIY
jgi:hypothetical protein